MNYQQPEQEPSWLEQDLAGMPMWGHLLIGVATFGIYFLFLPFILLSDQVGRASSRMMDSLLDKIFRFAWRLVSFPFRILWRALNRL